MDTKYRIAVLPFSNYSPQAGHEYFSDGITESIMTRLSQFDNFQVTSRTSVFVFKNKVEDIRSIGQQLGVDYVVEGSVRILQDKVRISAQLINAKSGFQIWGNIFNHSFDDIIEVEDELSQSIASQLKAKLQHITASNDQKNIQAYNSFLKGIFFFNKYTPDDINTAIHHFEAAIAYDPSYAKAYCGLSKCYFHLGNWGHISTELAYPKSKQLTLKALEINSSQIEAHVRMALIKMYVERNWEDAGLSLQTALNLKGEYATVYLKYAWYLCGLKHFDLAIEYLKKALEYDPLSTIVLNALGDVHRYLHKYDEAIQWYLKALGLNPDFRLALENIGICYTLKEDFDKGLYYLLEYKKRVTHPLGGNSALGYGYAKAGKMKEAYQCLEEILRLQKQNPNKNLHPDLMSLYTGLGDYDKALYHVQKSWESGAGVIFIIADPLLQPIRRKSAFQNLLKQIHFGNPTICPLENSTPELLHIQSEIKEKLVLPADSFLYAEAQNNYTRIVWQEHNTLKEKLLRLSMSKLADQLVLPNLYRCHRSYLINLNVPLQLSGNAKGYTLSCTTYGFQVPVSRSLSKEVVEKYKEQG